MLPSSMDDSVRNHPPRLLNEKFSTLEAEIDHGLRKQLRSTANVLFAGDPKSADSTYSMLLGLAVLADRGAPGLIRTIETFTDYQRALEVLQRSPRRRVAAVYGAARLNDSRLDHQPLWSGTADTGRILANHGWAVRTGGGPGAMKAAFEGVPPELRQAVRLFLPFDPPDAEALLLDFFTLVHDFAPRKWGLHKGVDALIAAPGGFGTLDELFDVAAQISTGRKHARPLILLDPDGTVYGPLVDWISKNLITKGFAEESDVHLLKRLQSPEEVLEYVVDFYINARTLYNDEQTYYITPHVEPRPHEIEQLERRFSHEIAEARYFSFVRDRPTDPGDRGPVGRIAVQLQRRNFTVVYDIVHAIGEFDSLRNVLAAEGVSTVSERAKWIEPHAAEVHDARIGRLAIDGPSFPSLN